MHAVCFLYLAATFFFKSIYKNNSIAGQWGRSKFGVYCVLNMGFMF